jgi:CheY-like chemotaxis protein
VILVVDDDDAYELLMPRLFDKANSPVTFRFVYDGEQAIDYLSGNGNYSNRVEFPLPRLVLLDLRMPRINGFEVLEWKQKQRQLLLLPVVVWSSSELQSDMERAAALGAADYIVKPVVGHDLIVAIERIYKRLTEARAKATQAINTFPHPH